MNARRRALLVITAGLATRAGFALSQPAPRMWRIGFLAPRRPRSLEEDSLGAFPRGMRELGYVEGKNLTIDWRFVDGTFEKLDEVAADLVRLKVDVIVAAGVPAVSAAQRATTRIPIVMGTATDAVGTGLVKSIARPGGNTTGLSNRAVDLGPKHVDLLAQMVPKLTHLAVLTNPGTASHVRILDGVRLEAQRIDVSVMRVEASTVADINAAFETIARSRVDGLIVPLGPLFNQQRAQIAALALQHGLPSISGIVGYADAGGLMAYGQNLAEHYRRAATFVDKILKGADPGSLPVEESANFELSINSSTARALKLPISKTLRVLVTRLVP